MLQKKLRIEIWTFFFQICFRNQFWTSRSGQTENAHIRILGGWGQTFTLCLKAILFVWKCLYNISMNIDVLVFPFFLSFLNYFIMIFKMSYCIQYKGWNFTRLKTRNKLYKILQTKKAFQLLCLCKYILWDSVLMKYHKN